MKTKLAEDAKPTNPFLEESVASRYEGWYSGNGLRADQLEKILLKKCLQQFSNSHTILDVGSGTGHFTRWFCELGFEPKGLDSSPAMVRQARMLGGPDAVLGDAQALPFEDQSFDLVSLITTLEFVADPVLAIAEAIRVSKRGLLLGVINRNSLLGWKNCRSNSTLWQSAHFFSPNELVSLVRNAAGYRLSKLFWRTTLWPLPSVTDIALPWGGFIGMAAIWT